ncbi:DUF262 domain-containing protein [Campylobacter jejuni]|uniref:DUF262 domain-containing protein n=1 Tax=Campylobacter jejuni TaxID=197 RepID=UPI000F7FF217|nr:DUF262 domain-containing protein [Campylobacter jejuni]ECL9273470.1 DUF262 domain-containing protein [Campylobacter jejuni]MCW1342650.1 DUF262 domain-containing HNH endonuclease family protein [Campylobacter jejuni]RTI81490.1 DUF262 domain-containing protein [Campylobacter jejuni]RTJ00190.1 DUF262 domain-containing protein [Campylobacter jejuni]RTJ04971.1 DUF262 domain-containing protein [Campylobacter jejuni]
MIKKVKEVLNNSIFFIPNYQRDYAWEEKNLDDLWEDLLEAEQAVSDQMGHFLGTIVVSKNSKNPEIYDIIDGQQRITTIFMLRYALNFRTQNSQRNIVYFCDDNGNFRLQVQDENKFFFNEVLKQAENNKINIELENKAQTQGQQKLYKVFKAIWSYVASLESDKALKLFNIIGNMSIMWLEEQDSGKAIRMFQTVNDRGIPLLILDKLKSLLILYSNKYCKGELDEVINERFGKIFKISMNIKKHKTIHSLGDVQFYQELEARIFNYHSLGVKEIGHYKNSANIHYNELKKVLKNKDKTKEEFKKWLDDYSKDLLQFFETFLKILEKTQDNIEMFKIFMILKINPYFYSSLIRLEMNNILDDECLRLFSQAEIMFYSFGKNDSTAFKLREVTESKDEFKNRIIDDCNKCIKRAGYDINEFISEISEDNYEWGKYFHYLFLTYNNVGIEECMKLIDEKIYAFTIEHIIPQNIINNGLLKNYKFENEDDFNKLKNTFGNLIPLEKNLNSICSDRSLLDKKEYYKKSKLSCNLSFANDENFLNFEKKQIIKRNEDFTKWARKFFVDFLKITQK